MQWTKLDLLDFVKNTSFGGGSLAEGITPCCAIGHLMHQLLNTPIEVLQTIDENVDTPISSEPELMKLATALKCDTSALDEIMSQNDGTAFENRSRVVHIYLDQLLADDWTFTSPQE